MDDAQCVARMNDWIDVRRKGGHKFVPLSLSSSANAIDPQATVDLLLSQLAKQRKLWQSDTARTAVYKTLQNLHVLEEPFIITAVCLAVGSFNRTNLENRRRSLAQLAFFLDLVHHIEVQTGSAVTMYAQDPLFTETDRSLLTALNITVLKADDTRKYIGEASSHFGANSLVAEFYMHLSLETTREILASDNRVLITTAHGQIERFQKDHRSRDEADKLKTVMDRTYTRYAFPYTNSADFLAFEGLCLLGKRSEDDAD